MSLDINTFKSVHYNEDDDASESVFCEEQNEFGVKWFEEKNDRLLPTPNQISEGIQKYYDLNMKTDYD